MGGLAKMQKNAVFQSFCIVNHRTPYTQTFFAVNNDSMQELLPIGKLIFEG